MDADTLELLRSSLRHVLTEPSDRPLAARLAELGWDEVLADDESSALRTLFDVKGDTLAPVDALGPQLSNALTVATGRSDLTDAAVVLPTSLRPPAPLDGSVRIEGIVTTAPPVGGSFVVAFGEGDRARLAVVPARALTGTALAGTDATLSLVGVEGTVEVTALGWLDDEAAARGWTATVALGRWLLAAELLGSARHVLRSAVEYTGARIQYGRPIGSFQALQHRIASAHSLVVGAGHVVEEASVSRDPWHALVAKALAGQAAETACTQAQQCYGAIGFTWEHEFHRYLRRVYVLDALLGNWRSLEFEIGTTLQHTRHVPRIGSL